MRRKQMTVATNSTSEAPLSPASTGAMDNLLEKLRAAAPQARDQRDRRRRARLKDRHQVRVASGQKMPDLDDVEAGDEAGKEPKARTASSTSTAARKDGADEPLTSPDSDANLSPRFHDSHGSREGGGGPNDSGTLSPGTDTSEGDVADRAASMLQGLRGSSSGTGNGPGGSSGSGTPGAAGSGVGVNGAAAGADVDDGLRVRRRRESADTERARRRQRRAAASAAAAASAEAPSLTRTSGAILEEVVRANRGDADGRNREEGLEQEEGLVGDDGGGDGGGMPDELHTVVSSSSSHLPAVTEEEFSAAEEGSLPELPGHHVKAARTTEDVDEEEGDVLSPDGDTPTASRVVLIPPSSDAESGGE